MDVVTGGAGFIGSHLSRGLLKAGRQVRIIDNFSTGKHENLDGLGECEVCEADVRDRQAMGELLQGAEVLFHQAALTSVQLSVEDPLECNRNNVEGTLSVLAAARDAGLRRVVFASSTSIYGDGPELPRREGLPADPISPYAVSKYVGELYCRVYAGTFGLPTVALRYFNVFGPRQDPESEYAAVIPRFISRMLAGRPPVIFGDGEQCRDFVFVEDVVAANLAAAEADASGVALNVASGRSCTLNELASILNDIVGSHYEPVHEPARQGDVRHSSADISLAREQLQFSPAFTLEQGLERTLEWYRRQGAERR